MINPELKKYIVESMFQKYFKKSILEVFLKGIKESLPKMMGCGKTFVGGAG